MSSRQPAVGEQRAPAALGPRDRQLVVRRQHAYGSLAGSKPEMRHPARMLRVGERPPIWAAPPASALRAARDDLAHRRVGGLRRQHRQPAAVELIGRRGSRAYRTPPPARAGRSRYSRSPRWTAHARRRRPWAWCRAHRRRRSASRRTRRRRPHTSRMIVRSRNSSPPRRGLRDDRDVAHAFHCPGSAKSA